MAQSFFVLYQPLHVRTRKANAIHIGVMDISHKSPQAYKKSLEQHAGVLHCNIDISLPFDAVRSPRGIMNFLYSLLHAKDPRLANHNV